MGQAEYWARSWLACASTSAALAGPGKNSEGELLNEFSHLTIT